MPPNTSELLERSRQELLDLSTRNRLLSIPVNSKSARIIQVHDELSEQVFRILVAEKKALSFLPGQKTKPGVSNNNTNGEAPKSTNDEEVSLPQPDDAEDPATGLAKRHVDSRLQTALKSEALQRRLLAFYRDARTMIEEQGVNILYLVLGHLKWYEAEQADTPRYAPLILVPVELQRQTASERFHLSWLEEDLQENLSLAAKLKADFATELPPFPDGDEFSPTEYFDAVAKIIAGAKGWEVLPNAITLGFFSFAKFLMYRDLDPNNWPDCDDLLEHAIITGLLQNGFPDAEPVLSDSVHLDDLVPVARLDHVVDADSSQTLAIESARQGCSMVIQGPPGTGKSQSITNIISTAVLDGKKVLFVAEKLAALEVVKRRLEKEGLGPLCLELHSNKCKKRVVIEEIGRTWKLGRPKSAEPGVIVSSLEKRRAVLNRHAAVLHERHLPSGLTPFVIIGHLSLLNDRGRQAADLAFPGAEQWTPHDRIERRRLAEELVAHVEQIGLPVQNPWRGVCRELVLRIDLDPLENRIRSVHELLGKLIEAATELAGCLSLPAPPNFAEIEYQRVTGGCVAEAPPLDKNALCNDVWTARVDAIRVLLSKGREFAAATSQVRSLTAELPGISIGRLSSASSAIQFLAGVLGHLRQVSAKLGSCLPQPVPRRFAEIEKQRITGGCVAKAPPLDKNALCNDAWTVGVDAIRVLLSKGREFAAATSQASTIILELPKARANQPQRAENVLRSLAKNLSELRETSITLASNLSQPAPRSFSEIEEQRIISDLVAKAPPVDRRALCDEVWNTGVEVLRDLLEQGRKFAAVVTKLGKEVAEAVWNKDFSNARGHIAARGRSWLRFLNSDYRHAISDLRGALAHQLPNACAERLAVTDEIITGQRALRAVRGADSLGHSAFGGLWRCEKTDWTAAQAIVDWVTQQQQVGLGNSFRRMFADVEDQQRVSRLVKQLSAQSKPTIEIALQYLREFDLDCLTAFGAPDINQVPLEVIAQRCSGWLSRIQDLLRWNAAAQSALLAIREGDSLGQSAFGTLWRGQETDWSQLEAILNWLARSSEAGMEVDFRRIVAGVQDQDRVARLAEAVATQSKTVRDDVDKLLQKLEVDYSAAFAVSGIDEVDLESLAGWLVKTESLWRWSNEAQCALTAIREGNSLGKSAFGTVWRGEETNWDQLEAILNWLAQSAEAGMGVGFRQLFAGVHEQNRVASLVEEIGGQSGTTYEEARQLFQELNLDCSTAFAAAQLDQVPLSSLADRCSRWLSQMEGLSGWYNYLVRARHACELGLAGLVARLETGAVQPKAILDCFDRVYYGQLLRDITKLKPELAQFDGVLHEKNVTEFRRLDKERLTLAKQRTLATHFENMPPSNAAIGPAGIVRSEMERKRGHRAVRRLLKDAGSVVQAIKPIFMMSPLSIAQFLEPGAVEFDLLVIDEASQVQPVDALGAIARCKQIVVVGDSKQLPPTRFFTRLTTDSDEPEDEEEQAPQTAEARDIESILGLCSARGLPQTMLQWHYRSRHHSLIAVSNHEFYENRLFIVPSPYSDAPELGLKFHHIPEGVFDAGGSSTNRVEAKAICRAIIEHARKSPHVSLGVAAFSVRQQQAILDELEFLRRENADTEPFFSGNPTEPFFVKNLENVQGDERDVVFISVGYGRDANGSMAMRFGPLSNEGGERRLNVLISRAKKRCEVFSSITADDIDLGRTSSRGVAAFKTFLSFAQTGHLGIATVSGREEDSPFEEAVRQAVEALGYEVHPQVGLAGFFIDLAVVDREHPGRYLLGIECDGAHYHSARCARDRDRLRQAVLEDHGWIIHRIWSTDWFQRPAEQLRKVANAIASAKLAVDEIKRQEIAQLNLTLAGGSEDDIQRETVLEDADDGINALATPYREARFEVPSQCDPHKLARRDMAEILLRIVKHEGPIHEDELVTRVRDLWGLGRAGNRIQDAVANGVRLLLVSQECTRENGFLSILGAPVPIRRREFVGSPNLRKPEFLPPAEIRAAILAIIDTHHGAAEPEIPTAVTRIFGFKSTGSQLRVAIEAQTANLQRQGVIEKSNGMLKRTEKGESR